MEIWDAMFQEEESAYAPVQKQEDMGYSSY